MTSELDAYRRKLLKAGFVPIPLVGKRPVFDNWQKLTEVTELEIAEWARKCPAAENTGILTALTPALDVDIFDPEAAEAIEALARERFEEIGHFLTRFGLLPKRAIPFRTETPFAKIALLVVPPNVESLPLNQRQQKIELLCSGQQIVVAGLHPDTGKPYSWHGGELGDVRRDDLPYIHEPEARALVEDSVALLIGRFGYRRAEARRKTKTNGDARVQANWVVDYSDHDHLVSQAASLVKAGMNPAAVQNFLRQNVEALDGVDEERRKRRLKEIPDIVDSAEALGSDQAPPIGEPIKADERAPAFSDEALALRFAELHAADLRHIAEWSKWLSWAETHWQVDGTLRAFNLARRSAREVAANCNKAKEAKMIASSKTVYAIERLARADRRISATIDQWDSQQNIINTPTKL